MRLMEGRLCSLSVSLVDFKRDNGSLIVYSQNAFRKLMYLHIFV